jgi:hypothetical protein
MQNRVHTALLLLILLGVVLLALRTPSNAGRFTPVSGDSPFSGVSGADLIVAFDTATGQLCHTNSPFLPGSKGAQALPACSELARH